MTISRSVGECYRPSFEHNWNNNFISTSEVLQIESSECKIIYIIFVQICHPALLAAALKQNPNVEAASQIITDQSHNNWSILVTTEWKYALYWSIK